MAAADTMDPRLEGLLGPWGFHLDLVGPGERAPRWPWEDGCDEIAEEAPEVSGAPGAPAVGSEAAAGDARDAPAAADGAAGAAEGDASGGAGGPEAKRRERKKGKKAERKGGGGGLARGFLNRGGGGSGEVGGAEAGQADAGAETRAEAEPKSAATPSAGTGGATARRKKPAPGHYWSTPPQRYEFTREREIKVEQWRGVEQVGELEKPTKAGLCRFYRLPGLVPKDAVERILAHCKRSGGYKTDPDSVDKTPTFEYYPFRDGEWADMDMKALLEDPLERLVLPYVRERYDCRFCAVSDILVRRYLPGERRTHAVHFDGHAFVTAVLGLSSPEDYEGGLYLQPEPSVASRTFFRIEPGDLVVHSFDLQHGVHVWKGVRYSLIFWVKDSLQSVWEHSTPWQDKLADKGDPDGLYNVAQNYEYGTFGKPLDINKAIELYERSAAAGHHFAQNNLGLIYRRAHEKLGLAGALQKSFEWLKAGAEAGFAMAQKNLALAFANGQGTRKHDAQAAAWMRKAAEQLEVEAAYMMGEMYRQGCGVPADAGEAAKWYERSAEAGFPKAQYTLGMLFLEGTGAAKDMRKAEMWMRFAARQGHQEAKNNLATMHAQRGEVDQAAEIWCELAQAGEQNAQCNIGMCYMRGLGRRKDLEEARKWLSQAAAQGHQMATQALVQLSAMSADDDS